MDDSLRKRIYSSLNLRETEDLLEIWLAQNTDEWQKEALEMVAEILTTRLGYPPPLPKPASQPPESLPTLREKLLIRQSSESTLLIATQVNLILGQVNNFFQARELQNALNACNSAIELAPEDVRIYNLRGLIFDDMDQVEKAIIDYQQAVRLNPEYKDAMENLLSAEEEIEEDYLQSPAKAQLDLAIECIYAEEPERAMEACELAKRTLPGIAPAYNTLGFIYEMMGQIDLAIEAYQQAIQFNPRFYDARKNLANATLKWEEEQYRIAPIINPEEMQTELPIDLDAETLKAEQTGFEGSAPGWVYLDEMAYVVSGWPGHRTRPGRSGYDPLDCDFERARIAGVLIRLLLTRKLRTRNPIYLLTMVVLGVVLCSPLFFFYATINEHDFFYQIPLLLFSPYWIVGLAIFVNIFENLRNYRSIKASVDGG